MTIRDCYEACLIELNKVLAPSLLLDDFVYLLNKNIQEYFNKKYTSFEKIQLNTDDLRQLINQVVLEYKEDGSGEIKDTNSFDSLDANYTCNLPSDYVHILGCRAKFTRDNGRCDKNNSIVVGLNKLDTNQSPQVGTNWYMKPSYRRPYYLIINIGQGDGAITPDSSGTSGATPNSLKEGGTRYGNALQPKMLIICGNDKNYKLESIEIQYLLAPRYVSITLDDLDSVEDNSKVLEFSDYICNEIIKQLVTQILENTKEQRTQSFIPVNQSIPQN